MGEIEDPAALIEEAVQEVWRNAEGPKELWAVQFIIGTVPDDSAVHSAYAPIIYPQRRSAVALAELIDTPQGTSLVELWLNQGLLVLPDNDRDYVLMAQRIVRLVPGQT